MIFDNVAFARRIITQNYLKPFYRIEGSSQSFKISPDIGNIDCAGIYCIYKDTECLYVGFSSVSMWTRIYRFLKELDNKSHHQESHSAAKKAREDGISSSDNLYIKVVRLSELPSVPETARVFVNIEKLDEHIATMLKAKYNTYRR